MTKRTKFGFRTGGLIAFTIATAMLFLATAFAPQAFAGEPKITSFTFEPKAFRLGENATMTFSYCDVEGGLRRATPSLTYQGSAAGQSRKTSDWEAMISGGGEPCGTFRTTVRPSPTDAPPFDIVYQLTLVDENGDRSNFAEATLQYLAGSAKVEERKADAVSVSTQHQPLAETLVTMSPWSGTWNTTRGRRYEGELQLVFTLTSGQEIQGRVEGSTGTRQSFDGPVTDLVLSENGGVSFVVASGAKYELTLDSAQMELIGTARDGLAAINLAAALNVASPQK